MRIGVDTPDTGLVDFDWTGPGLFPHKAADGAPVSGQGPVANGKIPPRRGMIARLAVLPQTPDTPALILLHGLEGGSNSRYAHHCPLFRAPVSGLGLSPTANRRGALDDGARLAVLAATPDTPA